MQVVDKLIAWARNKFSATPAEAPQLPMFVPNRTFFSQEMQSEYAQGLRYTVRNEKLAAQVREWVANGWVQEAVGPAAKIHGK